MEGNVFLKPLPYEVEGSCFFMLGANPQGKPGWIWHLFEQCARRSGATALFCVILDRAIAIYVPKLVGSDAGGGTSYCIRFVCKVKGKIRRHHWKRSISQMPLFLKGW